ncbi:MAG: DUF2933 domain-containing protein [Rhodospirillales bacterium]|jgi:hypothetical protein|nr:DUF2933 domain-containing protein [Rhodospirillales bacterium]MBT4626338.1 DUF2933 domain-containing protein [Rhodospirillales bacterium]MBT5352949.1 DUF2933 domain-containing protein [Rhodospirillales bacterium]MBT6111875.1 DUF2933 domain-containing protein [Rhodospirillales bacterium]MBT7779049.1 DUF2933 domain-containing protein [Rhodospirillales bacterium]
MNTPLKFDFRKFLHSPIGLVSIVGATVLGYYLLRESQISFDALLPFLLVGGCILMHLFMPHGHGHSKGGENDARQEPDNTRPHSTKDESKTHRLNRE